MLTEFIGMLSEFALFIQENGGRGDFDNLEIVLGAFEDQISMFGS
ncbi:hypothetical protein [Hoyosella rhizosphaerae]|uniref:Uncharacterized protein n=1 Tax=Hoyosella rhizosphaerae TaxID=1755582 RepID=A0A916UK68_9ACTN|nr:hypothetical protein [Hoyosella rhizosphaerae]GGC74714.1 hypothetical protein GCM10011410_30090 [Hoyosella rhizosphaerae]